MATKLENLHLEIKHFNNLELYLKNIAAIQMPVELCNATTEWFVVSGIVQVSTVYEMVMANLTNSTVVSTDSNDLSNGADCKMTTVRWHGGSYSAPVKDTANKTGTLYVTCYERLLDKFYYFAIPYYAYCNIKKGSNIEIPFNLDGTPRRIPAGNRKHANWWIYEYKSLEDLATVCGKTGLQIPKTSIDELMYFDNPCPVFKNVF